MILIMLGIVAKLNVTLGYSLLKASAKLVSPI
jgi:hypothetical protein